MRYIYIRLKKRIFVAKSFYDSLSIYSTVSINFCLKKIYSSRNNEKV